MVSLLTHICVTRPQWNKDIWLCTQVHVETRPAQFHSSFHICYLYPLFVYLVINMSQCNGLVVNQCVFRSDSIWNAISVEPVLFCFGCVGSKDWPVNSKIILTFELSFIKTKRNQRERNNGQQATFVFVSSWSICCILDMPSEIICQIYFP